MPGRKLLTMNNMNQKVIEEALKYEALGFSPIPLGSITKDALGKKIIQYPKTWKQYQTIRATPDEIKAWHCINLGIATGKISGLLVLDTDSYKEGYDSEFVKSLQIPITPVQETASGGKQYFFKIPEGLTIKNAVCIGAKDSGIDIRGDGGMVITAPTKTHYGEYQWLIHPNDEPLADVPSKLLEILKKEGSIQTDTFNKRKNLTELIGLKEGEGRNNNMASFIGKLIRLNHPDSWEREVMPMVSSLNQTFIPPLDERELNSIYESITKIELNRRAGKNVDTEKKESVFQPAITHKELLNRVYPKVRFTVEPFFEQGTMNMVSAPPNTWKSWLFFLFAVHIAEGTLILDKFATNKSNVMIVNEEDSERLVQDRMRLLKITKEELPIYYRISYGSKLTEKFVESLIDEAKKNNISVIMFDSLRALHDSDENDSSEMQQILDLLKKISREGITVIFTHHHRKKSHQTKNDDAEASRGSSAINAAISGHISLEEKETDDGKVILVRHLKSKAGEKLEPFEIGIETSADLVSFFYRGEHKAKAQALTEARSTLIYELESKTYLMGRKDFVELKFGGATSIKDATNALEKEGIFKSITRQEAEQYGYKTFNASGKSNEKLYYIDTLDKIEKTK